MFVELLITTVHVTYSIRYYLIANAHMYVCSICFSHTYFKPPSPLPRRMDGPQFCQDVVDSDSSSEESEEEESQDRRPVSWWAAQTQLVGKAGTTVLGNRSPLLLV